MKLNDEHGKIMAERLGKYLIIALATEQSNVPFV